MATPLGPVTPTPPIFFDVDSSVRLRREAMELRVRLAETPLGKINKELLLNYIRYCNYDLVKITPEDQKVRNPEGYSLLHLCIHFDAEREATILLKGGADPHSLNRDGQNALHLAVEKKAHALITDLVTRGVNPAVKDTRDQTPITIAIKNKDSRALGILQLHFTQIKKHDDQTTSPVLVRQQGALQDKVAMHDVVFVSDNVHTGHKVLFHRKTVPLDDESFDLYRVCPITNKTFLALINESWAQNHPYCVVTLHTINGIDVARQVVDARGFFFTKHNLPQKDTFNLLVIEPGENSAFKPLLVEMPAWEIDLIKEYLYATGGEKVLSNPKDVPIYSFKMAAIYRRGFVRKQLDLDGSLSSPFRVPGLSYVDMPIVSRSDEQALNFAIKAASQGIVLARDLIQSINPQLLSSIPNATGYASTHFPESRAIENYPLFILRELIRELPQPAEVTSYQVQITQNQNPDEVLHRIGKDTIMKVNCRFMLTVTTPNGPVKLNRNAILRFSLKEFNGQEINEFVKSTKKVESVLLPIFKVILLPSHPDHLKLRDYFNIISLHPIEDLFEIKLDKGVLGTTVKYTSAYATLEFKS